MLHSGIGADPREASRPLVDYLTNTDGYEPACSILQQPSQPKRVIELGAGQGLPSLALAEKLQSEDLVVITDLPEVMPLCRQSIETFGRCTAKVIAEPLAWGADTSAVRSLGPFTHVLMSDLVRRR